MRRRNLNGLVVIAFMTTALCAFAAEDAPPPPPPPPPPLEESGPSTEVESPSSGDWAIKGQNGLLDKSTGHVRQPMLSFFLGVPFGTGYSYNYVGGFNVGLGARFYIPIVKEGFLPMLNDSFGIEFGADTIFVLGSYGYGLAFALGIPVEVRWNFHLFPKLEVYAKVGGGVGLFFYGSVYPYFIPVVNVGALFRLNKTFYLRAELGYPAVKIGIGIAF